MKGSLMAVNVTNRAFNFIMTFVGTIMLAMILGYELTPFHEIILVGKVVYAIAGFMFGMIAMAFIASSLIPEKS